MRRRLTAAEREDVARAGHDRYTAGESWAAIARDLDLHPGRLRRIVAELAPVAYGRWGQQAVADPAEVTALRERGKSIQSIADELGCSRTAARTALASHSGTPPRGTRGCPHGGYRRTQSCSSSGDSTRRAPRPSRIDLGVGTPGKRPVGHWPRPASCS